ncbi:MAG UNVERIFIED_CONTAM: hypothetical protein LVR29_19940 [Microcystis novacekii LVE1205-3]|jgi:hypothetical protein
MANDPLVTHYFTDGGIRYILQLPDVYASTGRTIGAAMGITKASTTFESGDDDVGLLVSEGLKTGKLVRLRLSYRRVVNGRNTTRSARIICPTSKVNTALPSLKSKTYRTFNITGAGMPRRRRLG